MCRRALFVLLLVGLPTAIVNAEISVKTDRFTGSASIWPRISHNNPVHLGSLDRSRGRLMS